MAWTKAGAQRASSRTVRLDLSRGPLVPREDYGEGGGARAIVNMVTARLRLRCSGRRTDFAVDEAARAAEHAPEPHTTNVFHEPLVALCSAADMEQPEPMEARAFLAPK
jgi:hypothetical protein